LIGESVPDGSWDVIVDIAEVKLVDSSSSNDVAGSGNSVSILDVYTNELYDAIGSTDSVAATVVRIGIENSVIAELDTGKGAEIVSMTTLDGEMPRVIKGSVEILERTTDVIKLLANILNSVVGIKLPVEEDPSSDPEVVRSSEEVWKMVSLAVEVAEKAINDPEGIELKPTLVARLEMKARLEVGSAFEPPVELMSPSEVKYSKPVWEMTSPAVEA
jgi:hypothetical protein